MRWRYRAGWSKSVGIVRGLLILAEAAPPAGVTAGFRFWTSRAVRKAPKGLGGDRLFQISVFLQPIPSVRQKQGAEDF